MKLVPVFALGTVGLAALLACSSSDDPSGGGGGASSSSSGGNIASTSSSSSSGGGIPGGLSLDNYLSTQCTHTEQCFPGVFATRYKSHDDCVASGKGDASDAIDQLPGATLTQSAIDACAAAVKAAPCAVGVNDLEACSYKGTLAAGTACFDGTQCTGGRCKRDDTSKDCGVCADLSTSDVCNDDGDCAFGYECFGTSGIGHCTKLLASGASCETDQLDCAAGLKCTSGECAAAVERDGACPNGDECRDGLSCISGTCKDNTIAVADLGGTCSDSIVCRQSSCVNGTCVAYAKTGQACGDGKPDCDDQNNCTSAGTCAKNTFPACN